MDLFLSTYPVYSWVYAREALKEEGAWLDFTEENWQRHDLY